MVLYFLKGNILFKYDFFDRALFSDDFFDRGLFSDSSIGVYSGHFFPQPKNPLKPTKIIKNDRFSQQPKLIKNCLLQRDKKSCPLWKYAAELVLHSRLEIALKNVRNYFYQCQTFNHTVQFLDSSFAAEKLRFD